MSIQRCFQFLLAMTVVAALPSMGYAAAQLKAGAKTSAQPTSTNLQLRQIQITFDPGEEAFNVTSFQLSVLFDSQFVNVGAATDVQLEGPYQNSTANSFTSGAGPSATLPANGTINNQFGVVSGVSGNASVGNTQGGDVNIFSITFTLNETTSLNDVLSFTIFAKSNIQTETAHGATPALNFGDDFIGFTDPLNPSNQFVAGPNAIIPTTITGSFNSFAAQIAGTNAGSAAPLPAGAYAGLFSLILLAAYAKFRGAAHFAR